VKGDAQALAEFEVVRYKAIVKEKFQARIPKNRISTTTRDTSTSPCSYFAGATDAPVLHRPAVYGYGRYAVFFSRSNSHAPVKSLTAVGKRPQVNGQKTFLRISDV
jgi:hypothetical protein